ncbi:MAG: hypothetical protein WAT19_01505 [Ferruginibacter sp.]
MKHVISLLLFVTITFNSFSQTSWVLAGNGNTDPATHYIGTSNPKDVVFKRNAARSGIIGETLTSFGYQALFINTNGASGSTGVGNTAVGASALYSNSSGGNNTAIGYFSLQNTSSGSENTGTGYFSLRNNIGGGHNSAFGSLALYNNTNGGYNTAIGKSALYNTQSGINNTAVGAGSLSTNVSGHNNTIVGANTGSGIVSGSNNTILGANVSGLSGTLNNSIILADGSGNQRIFVNQDGNVGVGITNLTTGIKLNVNGNIFTNSKILINSDLTHAGNFSLAVNGEAIFNRAVVRLYGSWPDYVFDDSYKPESLEEVEKYIKENKHLKGMRSASEIAEEGIDLGENQRKMLEKIEELTLYIIEQNKAINNLQRELDLIKKNSKQ